MLKIEQLNAGYGDIQVLWDINLDIQAGEVVALIGPTVQRYLTDDL